MAETDTVTAPAGAGAPPPPTPAARPREPEPPPGASAPPPPAEPHEDDAQLRSREAATYRARLRATEAERDDLRGRVERYERAEVEAIARREGMATPADLWAIGTEVPRTEDGEVDAAVVTEHVRTLLRERPTWKAQLPDLGAGARSAQPDKPELGFSQLLKPGRR